MPDNAYYLIPAARRNGGRAALGGRDDTGLAMAQGKGVDLLVVPIPRIAEVYGDEMAKARRRTRSRAPHAARALRVVKSQC